jgi:hypothetical protein
MSVALRILDDGAWISVDDTRRVAVSELWRFPSAEFCPCDLPDVVVEGFLEVGVDGRTVETRLYGQCIACGESGTTGWLPVGRIVDGEFRDLDREGVAAPTGPTPHGESATDSFEKRQ